MSEREHYDDINTLVASAAKVLGLDDKLAASELESGKISLTMGEDEDGNRYVAVRRGEAEGRIYKGALRYAPGAEPADEPATTDDGTPS